MSKPAPRPQPAVYWRPGGIRPHEDEAPFSEQFMHATNRKRGYFFKTYWDLHKWSISNPEEFYSDCWDYFGLVGDKGVEPCFDRSIPMNEPQRWFPEAKLNVAENILLSHPNARSKTKYAVISSVEPDPNSDLPNEPVEIGRLTWDQLYREVAKATHALKQLGVQPGDSVATYAASNCEMIVLFLATISLGALISTTPAEFGSHAVIERFTTIRPKVLVTIDSYRYGKKVHQVTPRAREIVAALAKLGCLKAVIVVGHLDKHREPVQESLTGYAEGPGVCSWNRFMHLGLKAPAEIPFRRAEFSYPIWIVFSSGTTGKPKSIIGPGGGILLHRKVTGLFHMNLDHRDAIIQFATMGWVMYSMSVMWLATGGTLLCYDGSPFHPVDILWRIAEKYGASQLGVSPRYIQTVAKRGLRPKQGKDLSRLKQIFTTGAPVTADVYDWIESELGKVFVCNNCGGTEVGSTQLQASPMLPIYRGEIQVPTLGMDTVAYSPEGKSVEDEEGTMVIRNAFPSMPVGFVGDDQKRSLYTQTYFADFDHPVFNMNDNIYRNSKTGGTLVLGRSDGVLNPSGVRFGSAEIYYVLEKHFQKEMEDFICVGQKLPDGNEQVVLFVKEAQDYKLDTALVNRIGAAVAAELSRRHVPAVITSCPEVPYTLSNKRLETSVKKIINGTPLSKISEGGVANPQAYVFFEQWYKKNSQRQSKL